ncbi:hypothetical protein CFP56_034326 [Quercus suber]|uniref:Transmembrane protein n=1 Tax=Quercus suber TaxID=58331 RepID=A0AAW0JCF0_QUESU
MSGGIKLEWVKWCFRLAWYDCCIVIAVIIFVVVVFFISIKCIGKFGGVVNPEMEVTTISMKITFWVGEVLELSTKENTMMGLSCCEKDGICCKGLAKDQ